MYFEFICPPTPFMVTAGTTVFRSGDIHERRILKDTFDLIVINEGILYIQEDDYQYSLATGDFLILQPGHRHKGFRPCDGEVRFNWLHFTTPNEYLFQAAIKQQKPRRMSHKQYYKRETTSVFIPQQGHLETETYQHLIRTMDSLTEVKIDHNYRQKLFLNPAMEILETQQLFLTVLALLQKKESTSGTGNLAAQIYTYIASHSKQPFSLEQLSQKFSYHKVYIIKLIKDAYSVTPAQLHTNFRMEDSKALLENTNASIQEIAAEVGYQDAAYFSKQFKKNVGMTPKEFRKSRN